MRADFPHTASQRSLTSRIARASDAIPSAPPPRGGQPPGLTNRRSRSGPGLVWPRPIVGVAIGALERWTRAHRGSWYRSRRTCPHASLRRPHDHCRGPSLRPRSAPRPSAVLWPPLTPAAPPLDFAVGLYEPRRPDHGPRRRASRVPFASLHACCAPYPAETPRTYTPGPGCGGHGLRREVSGSALGW